MSNINYDLTKIKAFLFDVDGLLSSDCITLAENGGEGVARDIIEQTMKAQGKWIKEDAFGW